MTNKKVVCPTWLQMVKDMNGKSKGCQSDHGSKSIMVIRDASKCKYTKYSFSWYYSFNKIISNIN